MNSEFVGAVLGLSVVGLDPAAALVGMAFLLGGVAVRNVLLFVSVVLIGTPILGLALVFGAATALADVDFERLLRGGPWPAVVELAVAGIAAWYAVRFVRRSSQPESEPERRTGGAATSIGVGLILVAAWLIDPLFLANAALAGKAGTLGAAVFSQASWAVIAQSPTIVFAAAMASPARQRLVDRFQRWWTAPRTVRAKRTLIVVALALIVLVLLADAVSYMIAGRYLL